MTRLNNRELSLMDSRVRKLSQRAIEFRTFQRLLRRARVDLRGGTLLDAGCGDGYGLSLLAQTFQPRRLVGFDLMPEQVARARRRGLTAEIALGDITAIAQPDATFDGVFVFGILHHVPRWRAALGELARVLRPGGVLLVEELHGTTARFSDRMLGTSHPSDAYFDWTDFRGGLEAAGLAIAAETSLLFGAIRSFAAIKRPPT
jgi:ubiquinone/menaquinone biosynthesis C-methylase UbiE